MSNETKHDAEIILSIIGSIPDKINKEIPYAKKLKDPVLVSKLENLSKESQSVCDYLEGRLNSTKNG